MGGPAVFLSAIAVFAFASLGCALASSLPELVATRILQGAGRRGDDGARPILPSHPPITLGGDDY